MSGPSRARGRPLWPGRLRSAAHLRDRLDAVVDCTLWCLGCDVRHPDRNLLVEAGFTRHAPPTDRTASTMYRRADCRTGRVLAVWGFALLYADAETAVRHDGGSAVCVPGRALSLRRHAGVGPRLTCDALHAACWTPDGFPLDVTPAAPGARQTATRLLRGLADEIAVHERWAASRVGPAYRGACDADRPRHARRRQRLPAPWLAEAWDALAESYAMLDAARFATGSVSRPNPDTPSFPSADRNEPFVPRGRLLSRLALGAAADDP